MKIDTFLSPYVRGLLKLVRESQTEQTDVDNIISDGSYKIDQLKLQCVMPDTFEPNKEEFFKAIQRLQPLFLEAKTKLRLATVNDIELSRVVDWITPRRALNRFGNLLNSSNSVDHVLFLLLMSSAFERGIGDLVLTLKKRAYNELSVFTDDVKNSTNQSDLKEAEPDVKVPSLLKDLVVCDELKALIGLPFVKLLQVLLGSPLSLNLRNLAWHGFLLPKELPEILLPVFFVVVMTISYIIQENQIIVEKRKLAGIQGISRIRSQLGDFEPATLIRLVDRSTSLLDGQKSIIHRMLQFYQEGKQGILNSVYLGVPLMETLLRQLFVQVNDCSSRLVTAEATELYTTFTEMLSAELSDNTENYLIAVLGREMMELLLDLLVLPDGPRLRDRLSHGEADIWTDVDGDIFLMEAAEVLFYVVFNVITKLDSACCSDHFQPLSYKTQFHPTSILLSNIDSSLKLLETLCSKPEIKLMEVREFSFCKSLGVKTDLNCDNLHLLESQCTDFHPDTVHRPKSEVDHVRRLALVHGAVFRSMENTLETWRVKTEEFATKKLRSRQRATFNRMLTIVPVLLVSMYLTQVFLIWSILHLSTLQIDKYVKPVKKLMTLWENVCVNVSLAKNKWDVVLSLANEVQELLETKLNPLRDEQ